MAFIAHGRIHSHKDQPKNDFIMSHQSQLQTFQCLHSKDVSLVGVKAEKAEWVHSIPSFFHPSLPFFLNLHFFIFILRLLCFEFNLEHPPVRGKCFHLSFPIHSHSLPLMRQPHHSSILPSFMPLCLPLLHSVHSIHLIT
jgi:hypothetical protein